MVGYERECQKNTCRRVDPVMNASAVLAAKRPGFQRRPFYVSFPLRDPQCLVVLHILNKRKTMHEACLNRLCPANETFNHCAVEFPPTASDIYRWVQYSVEYPRRTPQGTQP